MPHSRTELFAAHLRARLAALPSHGWVTAPTAITPLPDVAARLGATWIGIKRDDQLATMGGSSKIRKLDFLLAQPRYLQAAAWQSAGAIGSGHLLALAQAARACGKRLHVHLFDEPRSPGIVENLAATVSLADAATFYRTRATLALRAPYLLRAAAGADAGTVPVVALGASDAAGTLGCVLAGLELAAQLATLPSAPLDAICPAWHRRYRAWHRGRPPFSPACRRRCMRWRSSSARWRPGPRYNINIAASLPPCTDGASCRRRGVHRRR
ncbi:MAG: hypothetical protein IPL79_02050 [Myxococcales bacterium]|nr:hypothetical protein [Myxococcales bacterium]